MYILDDKMYSSIKSVLETSSMITQQPSEGANACMMGKIVIRLSITRWILFYGKGGMINEK